MRNPNAVINSSMKASRIQKYGTEIEITIIKSARIERTERKLLK